VGYWRMNDPPEVRIQAPTAIEPAAIEPNPEPAAAASGGGSTAPAWRWRPTGIQE
jgi:hypothetical protein